jgi:replication-associated recombination protein RarA
MDKGENQPFAPLAERMRTQNLANFRGQMHLLGKDYLAATKQTIRDQPVQSIPSNIHDRHGRN